MLETIIFFRVDYLCMAVGASVLQKEYEIKVDDYQQ